MTSKFVTNHLVPYLKDLFNDLMMRSSNPNHLDKVTFIEYTKLPGIINDRLHFMFSHDNTLRSESSQSPTFSPGIVKPKQDYITEESFVNNFIKLFIGNLDAKMKFTFEMYDFDSDGFITPEDVRIMMSYMSFNRNIPIQSVQSVMENKAIESIIQGKQMTFQSPRKQRFKAREGMY